MHMSLDDFCSCTPAEFMAACKAHHDQHEADRRDRWELMRLLAAITVQPHVKGRPDPRRLVPLPWDRQGHGAARQGNAPLSKEESRARFEKLVKRMGEG